MYVVQLRINLIIFKNCECIASQKKKLTSFPVEIFILFDEKQW